MDKKQTTSKLAKNRALRIGGYSMLISLAVIAAAVIINLLINALPAAYTKFDTSSSQFFTLSDKTKEIVSGLDSDITVYLIAETGSEDATIVKLLERYTSLNSRIKVKQIDPVLQPGFTLTYTDQTLTASSLIFVSERRAKVVDYNEIYATNVGLSSDGTSLTTTTTFDGESQITGALDYVTSDSIPTVYMLTMHGESAFSSKMAKYIADDNIIVSELSLLTESAVPADCSALIINNPTSDISAGELDKVRDYIAGGGKVMLFTNYENDTLTSLHAFAADYGIDYVGGIVIEGNSNYYMSGAPYYLLPKRQAASVTGDLNLEKMYVMLPFAHGLKAGESVPAGIKLTSLFTTSAAAYVKTDAKNAATLEKESGDPEGPFDIGIMASDSTSGGMLIWISSAYLTDDTADYYVSGGNSNYFLTMLNQICEKKASVSIASKSMQVAALRITDMAGNIWTVLMAVIVPAAVILSGAAVWYRRKKR